MVLSHASYTAFCIFLLLCGGCAGPYNAMGPDSPLRRGPSFSPVVLQNDPDLFLVPRSDTYQKRFPAQQSPSTSSISYGPDRMLFSLAGPLHVTIKSSSPLTDKHEIIVVLNGQEISHQAKKTIALPKTIFLDFNSTYFHKNLDYSFAIFFRNTSHDAWTYSVLSEADCSLTAQEHFYFPKESAGKYELLSDIETMSRKKHINPSFLYGLINQESSFNPKAFSHDLAVGLTQMTARAARQVSMSGPEWPLDERLESVSFIEGKYLIETGQIQGEMDWRLGPRKSVEGGIAYLRYLNDFWANYLHTLPPTDNLNREQTMSNLVLASYNLGPARLKNILQGPRELQHSEWNKIRPYLRSIKTYCFQTSRGSYEKKTAGL